MPNVRGFFLVKWKRNTDLFFNRDVGNSHKYGWKSSVIWEQKDKTKNVVKEMREKFQNVSIDFSRGENKKCCQHQTGV